MDLRKVIEEIILEKIQETMADKIAEENTKTTFIGMIEVETGLGKVPFQGAMTIIELGIQTIANQGQDLEPVQTEIE